MTAADQSLLQPGSRVVVPAATHLLTLDVRWNTGVQTAFAERLAVAALPLSRGRLPSREHLVLDNQPMTPDAAIRMGAQIGVVDIDLAAVPQEIERIEIVVYVRPRPNAPRRTLDQVDSLTLSIRDGVTQREIARAMNVAGLFGAVSGATLADVIREENGWSVVPAARGHESGLDGAAATAGARI